ncbi:hypothetical protein ACFWHT_05270 [Microbacterium sp. NPDC058342]|uniref:hypothetical protein n=1 Tax=Microbacterium sp. NPDC058342 TaxID=3346454 RepID=UPI0036472A56
MSEPQPEYVWAFPPEQPRRGRVWLIVVLAVVAVAIATGVFWLFLRPGAPLAADPTPSISPSASSSPTAEPTPTATPTATSSPSPSPSATSVPSTAPVPPPPADPAIATFREKIAPILDDAATGLGIARDSDAQEAAQTIGFLQEDAGRLSQTVAPASISQKWSAALARYSQALQSLRAAYDRGGSAQKEWKAADSALTSLNGTVGAS